LPKIEKLKILDQKSIGVLAKIFLIQIFDKKNTFF